MKFLLAAAILVLATVASAATRTIECVELADDPAASADLADAISDLGEATGKTLPIPSSKTLTCQVGDYVLSFALNDGATDQVLISRDQGVGLLVVADDIFVIRDREVVGSFRDVRSDGTYSTVSYAALNSSGDKLQVQDSNGDGDLDLRWVVKPGDRDTMQVRGNDGWLTFTCVEGECGFLVDGELKSAEEAGVDFP